MTVWHVLDLILSSSICLQDSSSSADLGACYRIKHALTGGEAAFADVIGDKASFRKVCDPNRDASDVSHQKD